jgi:hypothetical protein
MLDLTSIPVVDNHCHPTLIEQRMDALRFRSYCTEASAASFAEEHLPYTVYYLWLLRQAAMLYGCERTEEAVIAARNRLESEALAEKLWRAANFDTLIVDIGFPVGPAYQTPERMGQLAHCRAAKLFRLETLMQRLILEYADFDALVERYLFEIEGLREKGYCGYKSIVAYRTGLHIREWSKDEAVASYNEARTEGLRAGTLRLAHKPIIDYLLHLAFRQASEQELAIQFHTGYGDSETDMLLGNPLYLRPVLERDEYRGMRVVLLHESYPYTQLGAYLAAVYPHVYFDLSYAIPFVDRLEMLAFTRQALGVAPASKLLYSSDGINIPELHWAAAARGRSVLGQVLQEMIEADELDEEQAYALARQILHDTAYSIYQL